MPLLIALTGLSGAGKTTAIEYFRRSGLGERVYLGQAVLNEVAARGLPTRPDTERLVRVELRKQYGPGALAMLAASDVRTCLYRGVNVLIDAIFEYEEYQYFDKLFSGEFPSALLAIEANFEIRCGRLASRTERPCTPEELRIRDELERQRLGIQMAINRASHRITNEGPMQLFEQELGAFFTNIRP